MVITMYALMVIYGIYSVINTPVDAIPDLSENQVIIYTEWMGRNPQIIEDQITYPLTSNLQGIPRVKTIRGSSMFGMSFVFLIFEDNTDIYWARASAQNTLVWRHVPAGFCQRLADRYASNQSAPRPHHQNPG